MSPYLLVLLVSFGVTFAVTPAVRWAAVRSGNVVPPDERRVHAKPTATLGGMAMFVGFLAAMAVAWSLSDFKPVFSGSSEPLGVVLAALVIFVIGAVDDLKDLSAPAKIAGCVLAGSVLVYYGVSIFYLRIPFGDILVLGDDLIPLVTVVWVIVVANAVNLVDGLDGLAAGIVAIAGGAFYLYIRKLADPEVGLVAPSSVSPLLAVILVGICLGFLPWNFHPAKIFMGDAGAYLLGLLMAASTMVVGGRTLPTTKYSGQKYFFFAPLVIPVFILGVPMFDSVFSFLRRVGRGDGFAKADKAHIHHRLMNMGHGQRRSVAILWFWTALLSTGVLIPVYTKRGNGVVAIGIGGAVLLLYTSFHPVVRRHRRRNHPAEATALDTSPE